MEFVRRTRRLLHRYRRPELGGVRDSRQIIVRAGPGAGLRLNLAGASADYADGLNELPVQQAVADSLSRGDIFVDIGANVGYFSLLAARVVGPTGKVIAVEAVTELAGAIRANATLNGFAHIDVIEAAASDTVGEVELMLARHPGGATISSDDVPPDLVGRRSVPTVTVDSLMTAGRLPIPTMVKIDVEGAEFPVLNGMVRLLSSHRPLVLCELDSPDRAVLDGKVQRFRQLMERHGYDVRDLPGSYEGADWQVYHGLAAPSSEATGHRTA